MTNQLRELHFNAFFMASPAQSWAGLWAHPQSNGLAYNTIPFWADLARLAERGLLDSVFLADGLGISSTYGGSPDTALRTAAMFPSNDPMMVVPIMAAVTKHLCFGITGNTTYEPPYLLARRFSTLDQLAEGRIAWNVVTGINPGTAKAMGQDAMIAHDARYDIADDYMDLMYKLWEGGWEDDAVLRDTRTGIFADPTKVHTVRHRSEFFACEGLHACEPSPQRTPLIFSAGASKRGIAFAGRHAECTFMSTNNMAFGRKTTAAFREAAVAAGRSPDSVRVFNAATIVVAPTESEARDRAADYQAHISEEGNLAIFSSWLGVDLSRYATDDPIEVVESNAIQSIADSMRASSAETRITVGDLAKFANVGGREAFIVGSTKQVCDELMAWSEDAEIDGFNLVRTVEPSNLASFVDLVVPELQRRGAYKTAYRPGTMREQLFPGSGPTLPDTHYAARFRHRADAMPDTVDLAAADAA